VPADINRIRRLRREGLLHKEGKGTQIFVTVIDSKDDLKYCLKYDTLMDAKQRLTEIEFELTL
jgi:hypothetical protein